MNKLKLVLIICGIGIFLTFGYFGWQYYQFAKGIKQDIKKAIEVNKNYISNLSFTGVIVDKIYHSEYYDNQYSITISLNQINPRPITINELGYYYYTFINDSLLNICIPQHSYDQLKEGDTVVKKTDDYTIIVKEKELPILSRDKDTWLP